MDWNGSDIYYGCIDNPECDFMSWAKPVKEKCPKCGGNMIIKNEVLTFDGTVVNCKCENCEYIMTYEE